MLTPVSRNLPLRACTMGGSLLDEKTGIPNLDLLIFSCFREVPVASVAA